MKAAMIKPRRIAWMFSFFALLALLGTMTVDIQPASALTANQKFASRVVLDFLNREMDPDELADVESRLSSGTITRAQFVAEVIGSDEFDTQWATAIYGNYLNRLPSETEFAQATDLSHNGNNVTSEINVLQTTEYFNLAGSTNTGYVQRLYSDLLFRAADSSGLNYWVGKLNAGTSTRGQVASALIRGSEGSRKRVGGAGVGVACSATSLNQPDSLSAGSYCLVRDRAVDASGLTHWSAILQGSGELPPLWISLASSTEYYNHSQL